MENLGCRVISGWALNLSFNHILDDYFTNNPANTSSIVKEIIWYRIRTFSLKKNVLNSCNICKIVLRMISLRALLVVKHNSI